MPFSLRLDRQTGTRLRQLMSSTGQSRSQVVREAVARYAEEATSSAEGSPSAYERLKPFIGIVSSSNARSSSQTHLRYRQALEQKHRGRRSR